jgi:hypothetical protein
MVNPVGKRHDIENWEVCRLLHSSGIRWHIGTFENQSAYLRVFVYQIPGHMHHFCV